MKPTSPEEILKTEFSEPFGERVEAYTGSPQRPAFLQGMRDRMVVSFFKYGYVEQTKGKIDFLESLVKRVKKYDETGNTEWLIDAGNFAMIESMFPTDPTAAYHGDIRVKAEAYERPEAVRRAVANYKAAGNMMWLPWIVGVLVDEFADPRHEAAHFRGTDSHESPGRVVTDGGFQTSRANADLDKSDHEARRDAFWKRLTS